MENYLIITNALFGLAIMIASFLYLQRQDNQDTRRYHVLVALFVFTIIGIFVDTAYRLYYTGLIELAPRDLTAIITTAYILIPIIWALWYLYVTTISHLSTMIKTYNIIVGVVLVFNIVFTLLSLIPGTNLYFTIVDGVYTRGKLFFIQLILFVLFVSLAIVVYIRFFKTFDKSERFTFLFIMTTAIFTVVGYLLLENIPFVMMNNVFNFMILAMNVQYIHATTDYLTGLANRRSLSAHLHNRMTGTEKTSNFSIIMFDFDNFKAINDTLGHDAGDDALRQFASFLKFHCKDVDFVARFGGDEFIIVLDSMSPAELKNRVAHMREEYKKFEGNKVGDYQIDFSAGYFIHNPDLKISSGDLIRIIDKRMFRDKRNRMDGTL